MVAAPPLGGWQRELRRKCSGLLYFFGQVLEQLSLELRAVFVLYELEDFTMAEIARTLDVPTGTVASRLRRGRMPDLLSTNGP